MARFSAESAPASRALNTASAAACRAAGSGANKRRLPSPASSARRTALFKCTGRGLPGSGTASPVRASVQPAADLMSSVRSVRANNRPSCSAARIGAARGSPDAASASTPRPNVVVRRRAEKVGAGRLRSSRDGREREQSQQEGESARPHGQHGHTFTISLAPPHLPVFTLKFPQESGLRQSAIRSREPSRYGDHS